MEPFIGMIVQFAGNFAPKGWALCDGTMLPISQNTALFSILGTTYGGDGVTIFKLPDLRGRACIHPGQAPGLSNYNLGQAGGAESVTLLVSNMPAHSHAVTAVTTNDGAITPTGNLLAGASVYTAKLAPDTTMSAQMIASTGGSQPVSVMQPFLAINWIIATEGYYPSRP
jgi:microcystin-dependent protein